MPGSTGGETSSPMLEKKGKGCFTKRAELVRQVEREGGHANKRGKRGKNRF